MLDKDYLDYLQMMGEETKDPKYMWTAISVISNHLSKTAITEKTEGINLMGQYKLPAPSNKGYPKGPPQSIIS